ncbi:MAG: hypothetical protein EXR72_19765 [Myxococcales bacterium]|nr:hypothetical protein [Myxococcales bacterium]
MNERVPGKVRAFRARFAGVAAAERSDRGPTSPEERLQRCLELHGFNLQLALQRVMARLGTEDPAAAVAELNRERLARSPMPRSLAERAREIAHGPATRPE